MRAFVASTRSVRRLVPRFPTRSMVNDRPSIRDLAEGIRREFADPQFRSLTRRRPPKNMGMFVVPQGEAYVVERLGKYYKTLEAGFYVMVPVLNKIAYRHSLKEHAIVLREQTAVTRDNVTVAVDGVIYVQTVDPYKASYGADDPVGQIEKLAQTTMRSEMGKMTLDDTFRERDRFNQVLVEAINPAAEPWGVKVIRYELQNITPPDEVQREMHAQVAAERGKRANILESEGHRMTEVNAAKAQRERQILEAEGQARSAELRAQATAESIRIISQALEKEGAERAMGVRVAEQYLQAFEKIAKKGTTVLMPADLGDPAGLITQALTLYSKLDKTTRSTADSLASDGGRTRPTSDSAGAMVDDEADSGVFGDSEFEGNSNGGKMIRDSNPPGAN